MTKIRKKAKQFVHLVIKEIGKEPVSKKRLLKLFKKTVKSLSSSELKDELLANPNFYVKFLKSSFKAQNKSDGQETNGESINELVENAVPYNLHCKPMSISINKAAKLECDRQSVYNCLLHQQIKNLPAEKLIELLGKSKDDGMSSSTWSKHMQSICTLSIGRNEEPGNLHKIMSVFHSEVMGNSPEIFSFKRKRLMEAKTAIYQYLIFFHLLSQRLMNASVLLKPSYEEYMASFLSLYVDMEISCCQEETEDDLHSKGRHLASQVTQLLDRWPSYILEVILQLTNHHMQCAKHLLQPILRKALLKMPKKGCFMEYTKYICCVRHVKACMLSELHLKVEEFVLGVPAPKHYLRWLREQNASLLDELPETKHFKGVRITHFLYKEASEELLEDLLQLLSAEEPQKLAAESKEDTQVDVPQETEPRSEDLYFFDTAPSADIMDSLESAVPSSSGEGNKEEDMDAGSIESEDEEERIRIRIRIEEETEMEEDGDSEDQESDDDKAEDHAAHSEDILTSTVNALNQVLSNKEGEDKTADADDNCSSSQMDADGSVSDEDQKQDGADEASEKSEESGSESSGDEEVAENGGKLSSPREASEEKIEVPEKSDVEQETVEQCENPGAEEENSGKKESLLKPNSPKKQSQVSKAKGDLVRSEPDLVSPKRLRPRKSFLIGSPAQPLVPPSPARRTRSETSLDSDKESRTPQPPVKSTKKSSSPKQLNTSPKISGQVRNGTPHSSSKKGMSSPTKSLLSPGKSGSSPGKKAGLSSTSPSSKSRVAAALPTRSDRIKSPGNNSTTPCKTKAATSEKDLDDAAKVSSPMRLTREHLKRRLAVVLGDVVAAKSLGDNSKPQETETKANGTPTKGRRRTISNMSKDSDIAPLPLSQSPVKKYQDDILSIISSPATPAEKKGTKAADRRRSMPAKSTLLTPSKVKDTPTKQAVIKVSRIEVLKSEYPDSPGLSSDKGEEGDSPGPRRSSRIRRSSLLSTNDQPSTPKKARNQPATPSKGGNV